jgi:galactose oxidase-like protein/Kelch motif protein
VNTSTVIPLVGKLAFFLVAVSVVAAGLVETSAGTPDRNALPSERMALVHLIDDRLLVMGGSGPNGPADAVWTVYPQTRTWSMTGRLLRPKLNPTVVALRDGRVLVTGGCCPVTSDAEIYDPTTGHSIPVANMTSARTGHTLTTLPDGRVLAIGGSTPSQTLSSVEAFDPSTGDWSAFPGLRTARSLHAALTISGGKVLVIGGTGQFDSTAGEIFDPAAAAWNEIVSYGHELWPIEDATENEAGWVLLAERKRRSAVAFHSYNMQTTGWTERCTSPDAHIDEAALLLPSGDALVVGGSAGAPGRERARTRVWRLNWRSGAWTTLPELTVPRANARLVALDGGLVVALGGYDGYARQTSLEFIDTTAAQADTESRAGTCRP